MNRFAVIFALMLSFLFTLASCGVDPSLDEYRYQIQHLNNFEKELFTVEFNGSLLVWPEDPSPFGTWDINDTSASKLRLFLYESKDGQICLVLMNNERPPEILTTQCYSPSVRPEIVLPHPARDSQQPTLGQRLDEPANNCDGLNYRVNNPERGPNDYQGGSR